MRVNADSKMLSDPRFKKLGHRLGMSHFEAFGRVLPVWMMAYENRSEYMTQEDVDALAEKIGFADAMLGCDLADPDGGQIRLRGVADRIEFLIEQDRKRELALGARRGTSRGKTVSRGKPRGAPPGDTPGDTPGEVPGDVPISLDLDHDQSPDQASARARAIPGTGEYDDVRLEPISFNPKLFHGFRGGTRVGTFERNAAGELELVATTALRAAAVQGKP